MSTTTSPAARAERNGQTRPGGIAARVASTPPRPARQHRRWGLFALAAALACVAGLGAAYFASQGGKLESIVVVRSDIRAGTPLTTAQLGTTQIQAGSSLHTIPASQLNSLVGKYPTTNLPTGALLTPDMLQNQLFPTGGKAIVGIAFKHGQTPARGLQPGDRVRLVTTAVPGAGANQPAAAGATTPDIKTWNGQVVSVEAAPAVTDTRGGSSATSNNDTTTYDLLVDEADAAPLASAAGAANVAAILEPAAS